MRGGEPQTDEPERLAAGCTPEQGYHGPRCTLRRVAAPAQVESGVRSGPMNDPVSLRASSTDDRHTYGEALAASASTIGTASDVPRLTFTGLVILRSRPANKLPRDFEPVS